MRIHPTAIVSEKAKIAEGVEVGPYALIEDDVEIGPGVKIHSHAHILDHTVIGRDCQIHIGAVLGGLPQIRKNKEHRGRLIIGPNNIFREYATVHRSSQPHGATTIGEDSYLMAFSHIAHDCSIGNHVTVCNGTLIAGHVLIEDSAFISGNVTVHQFCRIGKFAMIGGLARVSKDVPPYMLVKGDSNVWAINSVGLRRANISIRSRKQIKQAFKLLYKSGLNVKQSVEQLQIRLDSSEIKHLVDFILHSQRGICAYRVLRIWEKVALRLGI
ncbi:MAG: acyl-ACP--UDP-N-acetylglucosamine O-acyltransferase [Candidatus Omnitrophica bacterium]|nr:acyl-ACP--UDP-N-acetylglucosamine O-acyltransferase [Candidatus Omnitrophota bacterium]